MIKIVDIAYNACLIKVMINNDHTLTNIQPSQIMKQAVTQIIDNPYGKLYTKINTITGEREVISPAYAKKIRMQDDPTIYFTAKASVRCDSVECK